MLPDIEAIKARVMDAHRRHPEGLTDEETCVEAGFDPTNAGDLNTIRSRRSESKHRFIALGRKLNARTGVRITIWKLI